LREARKLGGGSEGLWKVDLTEGQKSGHGAVGARSDAARKPGTAQSTISTVVNCQQRELAVDNVRGGADVRDLDVLQVPLQDERDLIRALCG
jgi:hypothetical protein